MTAILICARHHGLVSIDSFDVQTLTTALAPGTLWVSGRYWGVTLGPFLFLGRIIGLSVDPNVVG